MTREFEEIDYRYCLAKTEKEQEIVKPGMTVLQHCVATGYIAREIARQFPYLRDISLFPEGFETVAALHDVGKVSPAFQLKLLEKLQPSERERICKEINLDLDIKLSHADEHAHACISYAALYRRYSRSMIPMIEGAHHGTSLFEANMKRNGDAEIFGGSRWQTARMKLVDEIIGRLGSDVAAVDKKNDILATFLLGLTIVSDWISSSIRLNELCDSDIFIRKVFDTGFIQHAYYEDLSFKDIFGFDPRPEQKALTDNIDGPGVYILEAGTGSGKTEAALYAAYKILSSGKATGIYFALPTTLTSRQIHKRLSGFLNQVLCGERGEAKLVFNNSKLFSCVFDGSFAEHSWFDSRKRLILYPFGAGTIDQALMSVIAVRHSAVRAFGLGGKVVIIDEVHSYDTYTGNLIKSLVKLLSALGATVIILSATLRIEAKRELLGSLYNPHDDESAYPCVTKVVSGNTEVIPAEPSCRRTVEIRHATDASIAMDEAIDEAFGGKYVLWIENTVDRAQEVYGKFVARCGSDVPIELVHSRFILSDRTEKEGRIVSLWGKDSWSERKEGRGFILIGTQVLEQSLDIDADVLFTRLAPADMIFQRMGRLWRHDHEDRRGTPVCHLIHPKLDDVIVDTSCLAPDSYVYSGYILYRTLKALELHQSVSIPDEIRPILEDVYCEVAEGEPDSILTLKNELRQKREKLERLADLAQSHSSTLQPDDVLTRYSEIKTCRILIISGFDFETRSLRLVNGDTLILNPDLENDEKASISLKLENSMLSAPIKKAGEASIAEKELEKMLSPFVYVGSRERQDSDDMLRIFIKRKGERRLYNISGEQVKRSYYTKKIGYYFTI